MSLFDQLSNITQLSLTQLSALSKTLGNFSQLTSSLENVANGLASVANIQQAIDGAVKEIGTFISDQTNDIFKENIATLRFPPEFPIKDLVGNTDLGYGSTQAAGGGENSGNILRFAPSANPDPVLSTSGLQPGYESLDAVLKKTLSQDWKTRNAEPGNPLIIEAYQISGRNYKKDGRTGEYSWHTAFVNWALSKAGMTPLQTMSAFAYEKYGTKVDFHNPINLRKHDIVVFKSVVGLAHIGFIQSYDPQTRTIGVLGGNQGGTVKITKFNYTKSDPTMYIAQVRRNWSIPNNFNTPLFTVNVPRSTNQSFTDSRR